jgi:hypothetical protein
MASHSKVASGNILPATFVKLTTTADGKVTQAGAGERIYGISQPGTRSAPFEGLDSDNAAVAGDNVMIFGIGQRCMLRLGGTVTRGDYLKSDGSGYGVTASTDADDYGAIAEMSGVSGQLIEVLVQVGERST